jgi:hypothetical protein
MNERRIWAAGSTPKRQMQRSHGRAGEGLLSETGDPDTGEIRPFSQVDIEAIEACPVIHNVYRLSLCGPSIPHFGLLANGLLRLRVWLEYAD